jgi:serine/threonine protein kinase
MAPEIFDRDYHWEADMWSLGIMLYQLYARRFPYWKTYEECRWAAAATDRLALLVAGCVVA